MDYSLLAGSLVTLSLLLLCIERGLSKSSEKLPSIYSIAYGSGVICWLALGLAMNQSALVLISVLQVFFVILASTLAQRAT